LWSRFVDPKYDAKLASYIIHHSLDAKLKAAKADRGSGEPNKKKVGSVTRAQVEEIAKIKIADMNTANLESAMRSVEGTARSMGVEIR
jgi:large subunit ribosomal protein L11